MIAIIDYGMGNLRSVQKGFEKVGHAATVTNDPAVVNAADKVVLPRSQTPDLNAAALPLGFVVRIAAGHHDPLGGIARTPLSIGTPPLEANT